MANFWIWIVRNLSNIFGVLGIVLTLYFGVYYVPSWLKDAQEEKSLNAQKNLQQSIKELVYSDSLCTYKEIDILIRAKELDINQPYPYKPDDLLTQVEESFMQDRFLPISKWKEIIAEIELLKRQVPQAPTLQQFKSESKKSVAIAQWVSIILSILTVGIGILSFYLKFKSDKERDEELGNQLAEPDILNSDIELAFDYEKQIIKTISSHPGVRNIKLPDQSEFGFDMEFDFDNEKHFVETKYLMRNKVGLSSFNNFLAHQKGLEGVFLFIYNTSLTEMVKNRAEEINSLTAPHRRVILIRAENGNDLSRQLDNILRAK
jgi:hypothetical protein